MLVEGWKLRKQGRRKAIAGLVVALLVFGLIFTTGTTYFLLQNEGSLAANQAGANRLSGQQEAAQEKLALSADLDGTSQLWIIASNVGEVPTMMTAIFVTNGTNELLSQSSLSTKSPYLVGSPDLSVNLPLTLSVGASTNWVNGCSGNTEPGCDIVIAISAFSYQSEILLTGTTTGATPTHLTDTSLTGVITNSLVGDILTYTSGPAKGLSQVIAANTATTITTSAFSPAPTSGGGDTFDVAPLIYVNVVTVLGSVFSTTYPGPASGVILSGAATMTISNTVTTASYFSTTVSDVSSTAATQTISSYSTIGLAPAGTNSLAVEMTACPGTASPPPPAWSNPPTCTDAPTVYQNGEVVLEVTVTNYSPVDMTVHLNVQLVATSGASMTAAGPISCTGGQTSSRSIPAGTVSAPFYCTYSAAVGSTGGTVTFFGYAVGNYLGPTGQVYVTSAEATSNPVSLGNAASSLTGPWAANYYSFNYESANQAPPSWTPATIISAGGNSYVAWRVEVTNTANSSLTILQYSYLQFFRGPQEMDYYIVNGAPSYTTDTLSLYNCQTNPPSATVPSGSTCFSPQQSCTTQIDGCIPVGQTATLTFAACYPGTSRWLWQNSGGSDSYGSGSGGCGNDNTAGYNPPEGDVGFIVVVYSVYNPASSKWSTYSQSLPFQGVYISS